MKLFSCQACDNILYFENRICGQCGQRLGYVPETQTLTALEEEDPGFRAAGRGARRPLCVNAEHNACNWLVPEAMENGFCLACRHNGTVPDLSVPGNLEGWHELEAAKHRLFYSLLRWHLPLRTRGEDPQHGLIFNFRHGIETQNPASSSI